MTIIEKYLSPIQDLCTQYHVESLYVFGSSLTDNFTDSSDIDFIVTFKDIPLLEYADNYFDFKFALNDLLGREIDLIEENTIINPFFEKVINNTKEVVYG